MAKIGLLRLLILKWLVFKSGLLQLYIIVFPNSLFNFWILCQQLRFCFAFWMLIKFGSKYLKVEPTVLFSGVPSTLLGSLSKLTPRRSTGKSPFKFWVNGCQGPTDSLGLESFWIEICRLAAAASVCLSSLISEYSTRWVKRKRQVFSEPWNNRHYLYFQNLICFWLSTPKLRFWCLDISFWFPISRDMKSWIRSFDLNIFKKGRKAGYQF